MKDIINGKDIKDIINGKDIIKGKDIKDIINGKDITYRRMSKR